MANRRGLAVGLPAQPGQLVGRGSEVALVRSRLTQTDARLLTLTGVAGTGKTRLAVEVAGQVADAFADGTYFVDLAPINDPALVATAVAQALDIREERVGRAGGPEAAARGAADAPGAGQLRTTAGRLRRSSPSCSSRVPARSCW